MSHYCLLSYIPDPTPTPDITSIIRHLSGVTHRAHPLGLSQAALQTASTPSASVLISLCHKPRRCLKLCSPPCAPPAPLSSGLAPSQASGGRSQDCLAGVLPLRCGPSLCLRSRTGQEPGLASAQVWKFYYLGMMWLRGVRRGC